MAKQEHGRVVVRRKRAYGEAHHGGSWKIAYSDFMTAMMTFFLVMWLLLLVPKKNLEGIAQYFRMPLATAVTGGPKMDNSKSQIPGGDPSVVPNPYLAPTVGQDQDPADRQDLENLEDLKAQLENLIEHNPVLKQFRPQLLLDMTPDGLRIQILDQQNRPMFTTGSAVVQPYMRAILRELAPPINHLDNSITLSGHTDATPYAMGDRSYSNWELSADRANAARRELVAGGLVEHKVKRILGLGDTVDLIKDDPLAAVNRRISILVLNRQAERRIDEQNAAGNTIDIRQRLRQLGNPAPDAAPAGVTKPASESGAITTQPAEGSTAPANGQSAGQVNERANGNKD
ncbi:MAG TPA: flagellar motor protein MotB [Castellaniella sp.]|uniref:flagellar motor protein MotB n=1 Tax=Castellaniella sp. TaxID=1955812 RepID=UPI002F10F0A5